MHQSHIVYEDRLNHMIFHRWIRKISQIKPMLTKNLVFCGFLIIVSWTTLLVSPPIFMPKYFLRDETFLDQSF